MYNDASSPSQFFVHRLRHREARKAVFPMHTSIRTNRRTANSVLRTGEAGREGGTCLSSEKLPGARFADAGISRENGDFSKLSSKRVFDARRPDAPTLIMPIEQEDIICFVTSFWMGVGVSARGQATTVAHVDIRSTSLYVYK